MYSEAGCDLTILIGPIDQDSKDKRNLKRHKKVISEDETPSYERLPKPVYKVDYLHKNQTLSGQYHKYK